jgi:hypothetical protein
LVLQDFVANQELQNQKDKDIGEFCLKKINGDFGWMVKQKIFLVKFPFN